MVDVSTESNIGSITITGVQRATSVTAISGSQQGSSISATSDTAQYWSKMSQRYAEESQESSLEAKDWANKLGSTVDGEEYSSKHYAQITQETATNAVADITSTKDGALTEITTAQELALTDISATQSSALTEIGDLKNSSLTEISASLENATGNITDAQSNAVEAVSTLGDNYISNINTTGDKYIADIGNAGENYIDNINATGKGFDNLTQRQITNCLLEVPQRIKYNLIDGTLTIKAGSVVIVPYGIEDLTADYPVGATFLHENFKVYDTQYEDGKFFVWAELVEDIVRPAIPTTSTSERWAFFEIDLNNYDAFGTGVSGTEAVTNSICYRTDLNKCVCYNTSGAVKSEVCCLPFMKVLANGVYVEGSVTQVFNGMGYIGSTVWLDKGIKALKTNGRNADGSLNNIEVITHKLSTWFHTDNGEYYGLILGDDNRLQMSYVDGTSYDYVNNYIYRADGNFPVACMAMKVNFSNGSVTSFIPYQAFQAVNYNQYKQDLSQVTTNYRDSISWFASPSNNRTTLTLGATGSTYTAPDNGWFYLWIQFTTTNPGITLRNTSAGLGYQIHGYGKGGYEVTVPCSAGQTISIGYAGTVNSSNFQFIYMRGAV